MADWSLPALTSTYTNTLTEIKNRDIDLALQFDGTTSTSIPTGAIRWTSSANTWQKWTGSAWGALSSTFAFPAITTTGSVGIGTSGPISTLDVKGGLTITSLADWNSKANTVFELANPAVRLGIGYNSSDQVLVQAFDSSNASRSLALQPYGGSVGIGTTSPAASLDIAGNQLFSAANPQIQFNAGGPIIRLPSANTLAFLTDTTTERARIDASGNVGIGTASPAYRLDVQGGSARIYAGGGGSSLEIGTGATGNQFAFIDLVGDTTYSDYGLRLIRDNAGANSNSILRHRGTGALNITAEDAGSVILATQNTERLRVDPNGRLGIATSSPAVTLDVNAVDAVRIASGTTAQRPTGAAGMIRYNSSLSQFEGYGTAWGTIGGGAKGSGSDQIFFENDQAITTNYTITTNKNAMTAGPVTVNSGITVTIPSGSFWSIV